jgi:hypothetical protein
MNRRERRAAGKQSRNFAPVAQQLAQKLATHCRERSQRYVLFIAGVQQLPTFCLPGRQGDLEEMVDTYARCVVNVFGAPKVSTPEQQTAIWYRSNDPDYRRQAVDWLRQQGGEATIRRLDGVDIALALDERGQITGMLWPDAVGQA